MKQLEKVAKIVALVVGLVGGISGLATAYEVFLHDRFFKEQTKQAHKMIDREETDLKSSYTKATSKEVRETNNSAGFYWFPARTSYIVPVKYDRSMQDFYYQIKDVRYYLKDE